MGTLFPQPTPFRSDPRIEGPRRDRDRHPQHPAGLARLAAHRVLPPRHAGRIRVHVGYLHQPARGSHQGLYHRPLRLIDEAAALTEHTVKAFDEDIGELRGLIAEMGGLAEQRSEEHTSELQSLMSISYAVFCLKKTTLSRSNTTTLHHFQLLI